MNDKSVVSVAAHSTFNVVADAIKGAPGGGIKDLGDVGLLGGDFIIDEGESVLILKLSLRPIILTQHYLDDQLQRAIAPSVTA